jgi:hypothetical protein
MAHRNCLSAALSLAIAAGTLFAARPGATQNAVKVEEKVVYLGTPNNIRLSNGTVELILTTDYGPRIMRYALAGSGPDDNVFATLPGPTLKTEFGEWWIRGGHRLWHAPESIPRTYDPDNDPVQVTIEGNTVKLAQPVEKNARIQKEMWVTLDPQGSHVTVTHKLTNRGLFASEMACWALSAMNRGGVAIFPQEPYQSHDEELLPVRPMVLWGYTNLTDPRWMLGKSFLTLRQDVTLKEPQKLGIQNRQGWAAYAHNGALFLKRFAYEKTRTYPDFGCNNETYTNDAFLELETLGPLEKVEPGQSITHTEHWWLYKNVDLGNGEAGIAAALQPILTETEKKK